MGIDQIKMMTFDVVGTLIDFEQGVFDYFSAAGCQKDRTAILTAFGIAAKKQQSETPQMPFTQMLVPIYDKLTDVLEIEPGQGAELQKSIKHWPAFPDSIETLRRLRKKYRLVAMTNADRWGLEQMSRTLDYPFADGTTCEDAGYNKPNPQAFAYCRGRQSVHGISLAETMHVAQSQYHDIGIAMELGYTTCWIERRQGLEGAGASPAPDAIVKPDLHFTRLSALADHLGL